MDFASWFGTEQLYTTTFVVSFVSGFVPIVNTEAYLLSVASLSSAPALPVVAIATLGQMLAKLILYLGGRGLIKLPRARSYETLDKLHAQLERRRGRTDTLVFLSAFLGLPPFYAVTILAGVVQIPLLDFLLPSLLGRLLRFGAIFLFPQLVRGQLG
jgi:membrane protein YqaA with SNARE-associated domain